MEQIRRDKQHWETRNSREIVDMKSVLFFFKFIYLFWEREREREREGERERERESQAGSGLWAQSLMWGSNPRTVRSWLEPKPRVRRVSDWATHAPLKSVLDANWGSWIQSLRRDKCTSFIHSFIHSPSIGWEALVFQALFWVLGYISEQKAQSPWHHRYFSSGEDETISTSTI